MRLRIDFLCFCARIWKETVALNLTAVTIKYADLAGGGRRESVMLSENEEPATGPRAGFNGLLGVRTFERERGGIDAWAKRR